jgi:hypothetical protein
VNGYPLCKIEAFAEAIAKRDSIEMRKNVTAAYVGAQASHKGFSDFLKSINLDKRASEFESQSEDFLRAFNTGFRGEH